MENEKELEAFIEVLEGREHFEKDLALSSRCNLGSDEESSAEISELSLTLVLYRGRKSKIINIVHLVKE